jgi:uncharacterized protein DUF6398
MNAAQPKVPVALQPAFAEITAITGRFCAEHLDEEYARLCVKLAAKLARSDRLRCNAVTGGNGRPGSSTSSGGSTSWQTRRSGRHLRSDELADLLGVKQATMANKGRLIMDMLGIGLLDPEYSRSDMLDQNLMVWMIQVNDLIVDAPLAARSLQVEASRRGLIPYVPAHTAPGDPTGPSAVRP